MSKIECPKCGADNEADASACWKCKRPTTPEERAAAQVQAELAKKAAEDKYLSERLAFLRVARETGDWSNVPEHIFDDEAAPVVLATSPFLHGKEIESTIGIVAAECVFGVNVFKDILMEVRDIVGGRSGTAEKAFRDARDICFRDLKREALKIGASAVVNVGTTYQEISGKNTNMLCVAVSGTAVVTKAIDGLV